VTKAPATQLIVFGPGTSQPEETVTKAPIAQPVVFGPGTS
jgi:hypothetical protein